MQWFDKIERSNSHILKHDTSYERALSILQQRQIHGARGCDETHEGCAHFYYDGWRNNNWLPIDGEHGLITLRFEVSVPARRRGEGTELPEPGWLEIYTIQNYPWQCCLHTETGPLRFVGSDPGPDEIFEKPPTLLQKYLGSQKDIHRLEYELVKELRDAYHEQREIMPVVV